MFRLTQYMNEILAPTPLGPPRRPPGPVVIWNITRRCNLTCRHCYSTSTNIHFPGELSTAEIFAVMDDLRVFRVPALILSGGEPLTRPDIFEISARARALGFSVSLSSNGTLIDEGNVSAIAGLGYSYVGISLDGIGETHDRFRGERGAFDAALRGLRLCRAAGLKVGLRVTLTRDTAPDLPRLLDLMEKEGVEKFYLSHLNYGGRGFKNRREDASHALSRRAMDLLVDAAYRAAREGKAREFVTGNNDADAVYLLGWAERHFPERVPHLRAKLAQWGGNASGVNVANIDNLGNVHPDTFWWHYTLGNVRTRPFSEIWQDTSDPLMAGLKTRPRPVTGRCGACAFLDICNGNTRVRAMQTTGDAWAEDPGCYLSDAEIGVSTSEVRRMPARAADAAL